jgi:3-isopropylmalate/(R)-2-methylmalate dehydratase small subunit
MEALISHEGIVLPMDRANVDTDAIIPKQFLKSIRRTGFGPHLFDAWRYLDVGVPGMNCDNRPLNPDFILNDLKYRGSSILLARENFGCGSSREHAPWALYEAGFRVLIAPSFADIFFNNSLKNGILPIILSSLDVDELFVASLQDSPLRLRVDLQNQTLSDDKNFIRKFAIDLGNKNRLMQGLDEIGLTLGNKKLIKEFEEKRLESRPWLRVDPSESLK